MKKWGTHWPVKPDAPKRTTSTWGGGGAAMAKMGVEEKRALPRPVLESVRSERRLPNTHGLAECARLASGPAKTPKGNADLKRRHEGR